MVNRTKNRIKIISPFTIAETTVRWLKRIGLFLIALLTVVTGSGAWLTWNSLPLVDGTVKLNGPDSTISITRVSHGIPFINAASEGDAFFALGYVHAQDRLFQMEFMRRLGAGRLAEVLGTRALGSDRFMRTLGLYRHAQANVAALDQTTQNLLTRYADGVNAWLNTRSHPLPPEFQLLQISPEPWVPADSLIWQKLMSLSLAGNWREELLRAQLLQRLSPDQVAQLWPDASPNSLSTIAAAENSVPSDIAATLIKEIDRYAPPTLASNIWTIDGQHTKSGKPLLASDPHLGFQAPLVWYLVRMDWPGGTRVGGTTPSVPFPLIGHNGHVSWGVTTTHADLQDLFVERLTTDGRYITPDGPEPFEVRQERIEVRFDDPVTLTVRSTRHGPVVSDLAAFSQTKRQADTVLSLSATMLSDDDRTAEGIYRVSNARTVDEVRDALVLFEGPQQNFMYADILGGIGYTAAAKVPIRRKGNGTVPVPGDTGAYDWQGWVPYEELPHGLRPSSGRLVNANNRPAPLDYPHLIAASFPEGYRAQRIEERLDALVGTGATAQDMFSIQLDSQSAMARDLLALLINNAAPQSTRGREALALLRDWDGTMDRARPEPLIFLAWMDELKNAILADDLGSSYSSFWGGRIRLIKSILTDQTHWCDRGESEVLESCPVIISEALDSAVSWLETRPELNGLEVNEWRWGIFHKARFAHSLFGFVPGLSKLTTVEIETDGSDHTINRGGYRSTRGRAPFRHGHGAGLRVVFDLADLDQSRFIIALGQSGHPASGHYDDLNLMWRDGGSLTLPAEPGNPVSTLILEPLPKANQNP